LNHHPYYRYQAHVEPVLFLRAVLPEKSNFPASCPPTQSNLIKVNFFLANLVQPMATAPACVVTASLPAALRCWTRARTAAVSQTSRSSFAGMTAFEILNTA
jgi:hypothetical protein